MEGVRPAVEADLARLVALAQAFRDEAGAEKGGSLWLREQIAPVADEGLLRRPLEDPGAEVFVGLIDDVDVGYAVVGTSLLDDAGQLAVLHEIYVEDAARGVGVGSALLEAVVAWARERRCVGLDAFTLPGARETKNFFEAHGLVTRLLRVHRDLT
ncbi:MAG TPA: GNAT family N-acetyltransferase [Acidimicrobiales bacterium]|nr:GNAT family N-acetyltransferase [Acidimicrobiales bacterium]